METNVVSNVSNRRKIMQYVLIGVYLCLTVAGLVFMKLGEIGRASCRERV